MAGPLQLAELGCRRHLWSQEGAPVLISFLSTPSNPVIPSLLLQQVVGLPGQFGLSGDTPGFPVFLAGWLPSLRSALHLWAVVLELSAKDLAAVLMGVKKMLRELWTSSNVQSLDLLRCKDKGGLASF